MKKPHPCGTNLWEVTSIMMDRIEFEKKLKKVEEI